MTVGLGTDCKSALSGTIIPSLKKSLTLYWTKKEDNLILSIFLKTLYDNSIYVDVMLSVLQKKRDRLFNIGFTVRSPNATKT